MSSVSGAVVKGMNMQVGFRKGRAEDKTRLHWTGHGARPLTWAAWYPAGDDAVEQDPSPLVMRAGWFTAGPVAMEAPMNETQQSYPVVLLSHGTGGTALGLEWLGRRLAQQGFVAIAANHHGNTALERYRP